MGHHGTATGLQGRATIPPLLCRLPRRCHGGAMKVHGAVPWRIAVVHTMGNATGANAALAMIPPHGARQ